MASAPPLPATHHAVRIEALYAAPGGGVVVSATGTTAAAGQEGADGAAEDQEVLLLRGWRASNTIQGHNEKKKDIKKEKDEAILYVEKPSRIVFQKSFIHRA
jgi:hypothetical protein